MERPGGFPGRRFDLTDGGASDAPLRRKTEGPARFRRAFVFGAPSGIRTRVLALKGPRPRPLDDGDVFVLRATGAAGADTTDPVETDADAARW